MQVINVYIELSCSHPPLLDNWPPVFLYSPVDGLQVISRKSLGVWVSARVLPVQHEAY